MPDREVAVEVIVHAPFATVWRALRDPAGIRRWHGWEDDTLDDEIDVIYVRAEADEAAGTIAIGDGSAFEVEDRGERTVVRVTMPAPAGDAGWDHVYHDVREGWVSFVWQLRFALEEHPGEERRTLQRTLAGPEPVGLALGGDDVEVVTPWGERLAGRVLFRTAHQVGLTVDAHGPGLLVVHAKPAGGMVIVTTYGLGDDAFAALEARWAAWAP